MKNENRVVYQIYPLTFNNPGLGPSGTLLGITEKLSYLNYLGVNSIWLSPIYESPMVDNGYDVQDYKKINPLFGEMSDFETLLKKAKTWKMEIIMDLVLNHTSDKHKWFQNSIKRIDPYTNYYVWADKPIDGFSSQFDDLPWTYAPERGQYYLHQFAKEQPDLNWENPLIIKEFEAIIRFWLNKGVKGFRLDVVDMIGKNIKNGVKFDFERVKKILLELGKHTFAKKGIFTVGECWSVGRNEASEWTDKKNPILNTIFNARYLFLNEDGSRWKQKPLDVEVFLEYKGWVKEQCNILKNAIIPIFIENHDFPRAISRLWSDKNDLTEKAKLLAVSHYFLKGIPFIYQGQELGLHNAKFSNGIAINDIETHKFIRNHENQISEKDLWKSVSFGSRDNARKPMPWKAGNLNHFLSEFNYSENYMVENQLKNPSSTFHLYKQILNIRKTHKDLFEKGEVFFNNKENNGIFSYKIIYKNKILEVISNWFEEQKIEPKENIILSQNYSGAIIGKYGYTVTFKEK